MTRPNARYAELRRAVRKDMRLAASVARKMKLRVTIARNPVGQISSVYITTRFDGQNPTKRIRVSDHDVPPTTHRLAKWGTHRDGTADIYASTNPLRRPLWWRRAIQLAMAGRSVPGGNKPPLTKLRGE